MRRFKLAEKLYQDGWIECAKIMPAEGVDVLVCAPNEKPFILHRRNYFGLIGWSGYGIDNVYYSPTHWRPLPPPPPAKIRNQKRERKMIATAKLQGSTLDEMLEDLYNPKNPTPEIMPMCETVKYSDAGFCRLVTAIKQSKRMRKFMFAARRFNLCLTPHIVASDLFHCFKIQYQHQHGSGK